MEPCDDVRMSAETSSAKSSAPKRPAPNRPRRTVRAKTSTFVLFNYSARVVDEMPRKERRRAHSDPVRLGTLEVVSVDMPQDGRQPRPAPSEAQQVDQNVEREQPRIWRGFEYSLVFV